ncbi:MAG: DNA internalization-related competence protein ComEC/Rec2 [Clostridia bacterium]|nr:DNA internalization-related competence protein ComEC/Rec2 [Clostridia bacterium]
MGEKVVTGEIVKITDENDGTIVELKAKKINKKRVIFNIKFNIYVKKIDKNTEVGDKVIVTGEQIVQNSAKNEGTFNYKKYLQSKCIFGTIKSESITKTNESKNIVANTINRIRENIKLNIKTFIPDKCIGLCIALVVGDKNNIDEKISQAFSDAGLSHIIAISGMHTVYVAYIALSFKRVIGKRKTYFFAIFVLIIFCNLAYNNESVYRATIMLSLFYCSKIFHRKSNSLSNLFISILLGLIKNPFCIYNPGFILSTAGTLGIIIIYVELQEQGRGIKIYIKNQIKLSLAANIVLLPIIAKMFNKVSLMFIITSPIINFLVSILMPILLCFSLCGLVSKVIPIFLLKFVALLVYFFSGLLLFLVDIFQRISILNFRVTSPSFITIAAYYFILYLCYQYKKNRNRKNKNKIKCVISIYLCVCVIIRLINVFDNSLKVYFVDVGQGDCTVIKTPSGKTILVDGGGKEDGNIQDSVGKNIVVPYLLNKSITKIDYIIISHFDTDHVGGLLTVMQEIKVRNVIISKQGKSSDNYEKFKKIVKAKNINIIVVKQGNRVEIDRDLYFDILWPREEQINENILNNNSIVCKLHYNSISILFTGDIEAIAEKSILELYQGNKEILQSTCLKVGHHGSKTSSTNEFLESVRAKFAFIGVGRDNKFGHPNEGVIKNIKSMRYGNLPN